MKRDKSYVLILASGGIDSSACIQFYKKMKFEVEAIYIDYGQKSRIKEYSAIKSISKYYDVNLKKVKVSNSYNGNVGVIPGRNAFLIFLGMMNFKKQNGIISLGIHKGTGYYDCSKEFIDSMQLIVDRYSDNTLKIDVPFLNFKKKEIWDYCQIEKVPIGLSYSCELGKVQPCGKCPTCKDLELLYDSKK